MEKDNWDVDRIEETTAAFQGTVKSSGFDYTQAGASIREYVKRRPGRSLLMAGAAGFIIGAVLRRR